MAINTVDKPRQPRPVSAFERIRRARGLKQSEVAEQAGVSRSYIALAEGGWRPPLMRQEAIAEVLGVTPADLWPVNPYG